MGGTDNVHILEERPKLNLMFVRITWETYGEVYQMRCTWFLISVDKEVEEMGRNFDLLVDLNKWNMNKKQDNVWMISHFQWVLSVLNWL